MVLIRISVLIKSIGMPFKINLFPFEVLFFFGSIASGLKYVISYLNLDVGMEMKNKNKNICQNYVMGISLGR